jgi:YVTN family beta-propeller protein
VTNAGDNTVSIIDGQRNTVLATVGVGSYPFAVAVDPTTRRAFVVNETGGSVSVIDGETNTVTATIAVDNVPSAIAVDPTTSRVYVAHLGADTWS